MGGPVSLYAWMESSRWFTTRKGNQCCPDLDHIQENSAIQTESHDAMDHNPGCCSSGRSRLIGEDRDVPGSNAALLCDLPSQRRACFEADLVHWVEIDAGHCLDGNLHGDGRGLAGVSDIAASRFRGPARADGFPVTHSRTGPGVDGADGHRAGRFSDCGGDRHHAHQSSRSTPSN